MRYVATGCGDNRELENEFMAYNILTDFGNIRILLLYGKKSKTINRTKQKNISCRVA